MRFRLDANRDDGDETSADNACHTDDGDDGPDGNRSSDRNLLDLKCPSSSQFAKVSLQGKLLRRRESIPHSEKPRSQWPTITLITMVTMEKTSWQVAFSVMLFSAIFPARTCEAASPIL